MEFKITKPTTPSLRHLIRFKNNQLSTKPLLKEKILSKVNKSGRNNTGKITVYHKGGGSKKRFRDINFCRETSSKGIVCSIEYDPNRTSFIASVFDSTDSKFCYILAPRDIKIGDIVQAGDKIEPSLGSSLLVSLIPSGTPIHNISTKNKKKASISRSAGTFSIVRETKGKYTTLELSSGQLIQILNSCFATVGEVSNPLSFLTQHSKAGHSRWLNKRPTVRGVAMNPIDHPHGGGEGKKSGKSKSPWGKPC